jgi:hypothetical protein
VKSKESLSKSAPKSKSAEPSTVWSFGLPRAARQLAVWGLLIAGAAGAWHFTWSAVRDRVAYSGDYRVTPDRIETTPPPPWLERDVMKDVLENGLDGPLSILDPTLAERVARAFSGNPWVKRVVRVETSYPAHVRVELAYRGPAALVAVGGRLYPVDSETVLLPGSDLAKDFVGRIPRIEGIETTPVGPSGTAWKDSTVADAVSLASVLVDVWIPWNLHHIEPIPPEHSPSDSGGVQFGILTRGGRPIRWGLPPSAEARSPVSTKDRLERLTSWIRDRGSLDDSGDQSEIDLTQPEPAPTTALEEGRLRG